MKDIEGEIILENRKAQLSKVGGEYVCHCVFLCQAVYEPCEFEGYDELQPTGDATLIETQVQVGDLTPQEAYKRFREIRPMRRTNQ